MLHAGFLPEPGDPDRKPFLDTLGQGQRSWPQAKGVTVAFETGQETADLLRRTLDELKCPNLKVNFDPANMLLYDKGDPLRAVEILGPDIRSVHVKDANRPKVPGHLGRGSAAGPGAGQHSAVRPDAARRSAIAGPLCIEREVGDQEQRVCRRRARHPLSCASAWRISSAEWRSPRMALYRHPFLAGCTRLRAVDVVRVQVIVRPAIPLRQNSTKSRREFGGQAHRRKAG